MHACLNSNLTKLFQAKLLYETVRNCCMHNKCMGLCTETYSAIDDNLLNDMPSADVYQHSNWRTLSHMSKLRVIKLFN